MEETCLDFSDWNEIDVREECIASHCDNLNDCTKNELNKYNDKKLSLKTGLFIVIVA